MVLTGISAASRNAICVRNIKFSYGFNRYWEDSVFRGVPGNRPPARKTSFSTAFIRFRGRSRTRERTRAHEIPSIPQGIPGILRISVCVGIARWRKPMFSYGFNSHFEESKLGAKHQVFLKEYQVFRRFRVPRNRPRQEISSFLLLSIGFPEGPRLWHATAYSKYQVFLKEYQVFCRF